MDYVIREARESDLPHLAFNLRGADAREVIASWGNLNFLGALTASYRNSEEVLVAADAEDKPFVIWGRCEEGRKSHLIWCLATPAVSQWRVPFVRVSRQVLRKWFQENPELQVLFNYSHSANTLHHKWLRSVGATIFAPVQMGPLGENFSPFLIKRYPDV